jgi:hypothetical protein
MTWNLLHMKLILSPQGSSRSLRMGCNPLKKLVYENVKNKITGSTILESYIFLITLHFACMFYSNTMIHWNLVTVVKPWYSKSLTGSSSASEYVGI